MLRIKLTRLGKKKQPFYRIVVTEKRSKRDGKFVDLVGTYNPMTNPGDIKIDMAKYSDWVTKGAQPTETVASLYKKASKAK